MNFDWPLIIDLTALTLAVSLVLWGIKIFRAYVIFLGALIGGVAGFLLGMLLVPDNNLPLILAVIFAGIGGLISWPLQKVYIFLTAGLTAVLSGIGALSAFGIASNPLSVTTLVIFLIGGVLALLLFDYVIVLVTAFAGGHILFSVIYSGDLSMFLTSKYQTSLDSWFDRLVRSIGDQFPAYLLCIIVMVSFALYIQRFKAFRKTDTEQERSDKRLLRRISFLFAFLFLAAFLVIRLAESWIEAQMLTGYSLLAWPFISIVVVMLIKQMRQPEHSQLSSWKRFAILSAVGLTVLPATSYIITAIVQSDLPVPWFYVTFAGVSPAFTAAKVLYSTLLLPLFLLPYVVSNGVELTDTDNIPDEEQLIEELDAQGNVD